MKMYTIKKGSLVRAIDEKGKCLGSSIFNRNVKFSENWFNRIIKCSCCEDKMYSFHHKNVPFVTTDIKNVTVEVI